MIRHFLNSISHPSAPLAGTGPATLPQRLRGFSAIAAAGIFALSSPLSAASIVQTASFEADSFVPFLETTLPIAIAIPSSKSDTYSNMDESTATFDPFDPTLGNLTSVSWYFDIQASLEGDSLYGCVGLFSIGCKMETTLDFDLTANAFATVKGDRTIKVPLPSGDVVEIIMPQENVILPGSVAISETEEPSPSGLVGCIAKEVLGFDETCQGGTLQEDENQQTIADAPLEAYTNGDIEVTFRAIAEGSIDTTCQLFGVLGSCYSRNFPEASASFFASLTYTYSPFTTPDPTPNPTPAPAVPLPAGFPLLIGAIGVLGLAKRRQKRASVN